MILETLCADYSACLNVRYHEYNTLWSLLFFSMLTTLFEPVSAQPAWT